jgi:two-component system phosphate regulon response regulator OmpR
VLEAGCGAELAAVLAAEDVTVLLLDIGLGADDGVEIARRLRDERPDLPIAFFSGSAAPLERDVRELAQHVLTKPFSLEELTGTVALLAGR